MGVCCYPVSVRGAISDNPVMQVIPHQLPVVRAEVLKFKEDGVRDVVKDVFLPWYNAYRFLAQNV